MLCWLSLAGNLNIYPADSSATCELQTDAGMTTTVTVLGGGTQQTTLQMFACNWTNHGVLNITTTQSGLQIYSADGATIFNVFPGVLYISGPATVVLYGLLWISGPVLITPANPYALNVFQATVFDFRNLRVSASGNDTDCPYTNNCRTLGRALSLWGTTALPGPVRVIGDQPYVVTQTLYVVVPSLRGVGSPVLSCLVSPCIFLGGGGELAGLTFDGSSYS